MAHNFVLPWPAVPQKSETDRERERERHSNYFTAVHVSCFCNHGSIPFLDRCSYKGCVLVCVLVLCDVTVRKLGLLERLVAEVLRNATLDVACRGWKIP